MIDNLDMKTEARKVMLVLGAILMSTGLKDYIPSDMGADMLILGGVGITILGTSDRW
jgi:hypothetical protein